MSRNRSLSRRTIGLIVLLFAVELLSQLPLPRASPSPNSMPLQTSSMGGINMILWDDSETRYKSEYFDWLKSYGITYIMLNFGWNKLEPTKGVYNQNYLGVMDWFVQQAKSRGIYVLLRMHKWVYPDAYQAKEPTNIWLLGYPAWLSNTPDFWNDVSNCWDRYVAMWVMLATHYANESNVVGFDLFSEPGNDIGPAYGDSNWYDWDSNAARKTMSVLFDVNRLYETTINAIHAVTGKPVIIESFGGNGLGYAKTPGAASTLVSKPQSQNFVVSESVYQDIQFAWVDQHKSQVDSWNVPFIATEFGVKASNITNPNPTDVAWVEQACQQFTADSMGWFYWDFGPGPNGDYNLVHEPDDAVSPILNKILPTDCLALQALQLASTTSSSSVTTSTTQSSTAMVTSSSQTDQTSSSSPAVSTTTQTSNSPSTTVGQSTTTSSTSSSLTSTDTNSTTSSSAVTTTPISTTGQATSSSTSSSAVPTTNQATTTSQSSQSTSSSTSTAITQTTTQTTASTPQPTTSQTSTASSQTSAITSSSTTQSSTQSQSTQSQQTTVTQSQPSTITSSVTVVQSVTVTQSPATPPQTVTVTQAQSQNTVTRSVTVVQAVIQTQTVTQTILSSASGSSTSTASSTKQSTTLSKTSTTSSSTLSCRLVKCADLWFQPYDASSWWVSIFLLITGAWLGLQFPSYRLAARAKLSQLMRLSSRAL